VKKMGLKVTVVWLGIILMIPSIAVLKNNQPNPLSGENVMDYQIIQAYPTECDTASENDPSMKDNAAHFIYYQDEPNIKYWREWWYLNVYDTNGRYWFLWGRMAQRFGQ
jgi:hypothetical protein